MAAPYGRLTGHPGVCMSTLGPGALNLATGAAYATRGDADVLHQGEKAIRSSQQARLQIVDMVATMKPLTKPSRQTSAPAAFLRHRPGGLPGRWRRNAWGWCTLKLPEDVAGEKAIDVAMVPGHEAESARRRRFRPSTVLLDTDPVRRYDLLVNAGCGREPSAAGLWSRPCSSRAPHPPFSPQMGKGIVAEEPDAAVDHGGGHGSAVRA